ncbi:2-hydroxy-3-oxopropionate reductase [Lactobacillus sp. ESL0791]|uniref:2-hydroxy-3-oxopropionate reductase n=1 Tax=Lactobacillus sp. ESL0791 TaxID=2983234 RepID=UPI0023F7A0E1|nr:2-hydroxy-3-oxopropionate reductase [Lactobacillus sp. ESL0791]MDF7639855.1 2-hydroxy-3-oxopropionate reductase [Lactobacillus sp. ESL0791]
MKRIGFIGLGIMGNPMSQNLLKAGFNVSVNDLNDKAVAKLAALGAKEQTPENMAKNTDIIITMLPAAKQVWSVLNGPKGILQNAHPGLIILDMSSIGPTDAKAIAQEAATHQVETLDAPVSGGEPKAIDGTLSIMVGGKKETFAKVTDVLQAMGHDIVLVGDHGSGVTAKLANQIIVNLNIAALSEALVLAAKAGIDIEKMYQAIRGGLAGSAVMDAKVPLILDRNFKPGGTMAINMKDLTNVLQTAHDLDVPVPFSSQLLEIFHALKADGKIMDDHGGIVQYFEKIANVTVTRGEK